MNFFKYFPTVLYSFQTVATERGFEVTNMTVHFKMVEKLKQNITVFYDYIVQDGERPDTVATKLYGSPAYTWVVLLLNNIMSLYDWPLNNEEFNNYIIERYGSVVNAQLTTIFKTAQGYVVDGVTYGLLLASEQGPALSAYDDELEQNDAKRRIRVLPAEFIGPLMLDLKAAMK